MSQVPYHTCTMFKSFTTHSMFNRTFSSSSSSRSLTTISTFSNFTSKNNTHHFLPIFPSTHRVPSVSFPTSFSVRMASGEQKFPPQKQNTQPGKEHVMDPLPQFTNPDYKPSNKLQVYLYIFTFKYCLLVQVVCTIHILKENLMFFFSILCEISGKDSCNNRR